MGRLLFSIVLFAAGCATTKYVPAARTNHAAALKEARGSFVSINEPRIKAISLAPPFECDADTVRLAREGPSTIPEEPKIVKTFGSFTAPLSAGVYRVHTIQGGMFFVISGDKSSDPAVSLLNIVNRYNDVAECEKRWK
jgi:hypothetical protein